MRLLIVLVCGLAAAHATQEEWEAWKEEYGRTYLDDDEESYRQSIFEDNLAFINTHNAEFENGEHTFTVGMNQFGDMLTSEVQSYMLGFKQDPTSDKMARRVLKADKHDKLPKEIDWRTKAPGSVSAVKDQKMCGSCWAFSATGSLEGQHFLKTNKSVSLSEQNIVDCDKVDHGCFGGLMDNAFKFIMKNKGIDTEAAYPYLAKNGNCTYKNDSASVGATLTGFVDVEHGSEKALEKAVATIGPISVAIDAHLPTFHFYKSGIYHDKKCSSIHLDHGVLAVGYGMDNSTIGEDGHPGLFWEVKNSWNAGWGDKGYIKMARNKNNACGIATQASYPTV